MIDEFRKSVSNSLNSIGNKIKGISTKQALKLVGEVIKHASSDQAAKLLQLLEFLAAGEDSKRTVRDIKKDFQKKGPWYVLLRKLFKEINSNCREKLINNLVMNQMLNGELKRAEFSKREGFPPPYFIVLSPSMTCNLRCIGCYAGEYSKKDNLPFKDFDRVIQQGKEIGIYFYTVSGGEPFFNPDNIKIFEKHKDCYFLVYTNGTLIDKKLAKKIAELGNVAPGISVEGMEKETDRRRGKGTWGKILQAMKNLKDEGVAFGFSATQTSLNSDILVTEKFIDFFVKQGCMFGWFFQYIPIGRNPDTSLMATPEQRNKLRLFVNDVCREKKPIFIGDFWNDGPHVGGCMAGGSFYLHINVKGDVEPCVFAHFAVDNIKNKSLQDALKSDFFKHLRAHVQSTRASDPKSDNLLTPCMIIDNPEVLREAVKAGKAHPTHDGAETIVEDAKIKKHLDKYSKEWHNIADPVWKKEYCSGNCDHCKK